VLKTLNFNDPDCKPRL